MGLLVDGQWQDVWYDTKSNRGRFERKASQFRNWVTPDGVAGTRAVRGFIELPVIDVSWTEECRQHHVQGFVEEWQ